MRLVDGAAWALDGGLPMPWPARSTFAMQCSLWHRDAGDVRGEDVPEAQGSGQDVLMPPQRRNWKRCASHVYIAHFIEYQLHRERCGLNLEPSHGL